MKLIKHNHNHEFGVPIHDKLMGNRVGIKWVNYGNFFYICDFLGSALRENVERVQITKNKYNIQ